MAFKLSVKKCDRTTQGSCERYLECPTSKCLPLTLNDKHKKYTMKNFALLASLLILHSLGIAQISTLNRPNDPVVLSGSQLSSFSSLSPGQIVGFKFANNTWTQIPIQVDEKALLDIVTPYGPLAAGEGYPPSSSNPKITFYCDANTYVGADPITTFDSDDELVFMVKDAGEKSNGTYPLGVVVGSCQQITITDPLGGVGYVYLFQNGGSLQQGAGVSYITYTSNLASTPGFPANKNIVNLENTSIVTSKYTWHFSAEWVSDEFKIVVGNNTDLLDRYKSFFSNSSCLRHEDAFSAAENAYATAKAGPIRAIRSYMGANSGPLTQRTHIFYEGRQDIATDLRVHNIVSIYDAFDYNSAANGMIYRNNLNTNGVTINGQQDAVTSGDLTWEQVSGTPGTISILHRRTTTLSSGEATFTSYYDDNSANPASNCTGDGQAWGTSGGGVLFSGGSVCTDPMGNGCAGSQWLRNLQSKRTVYADPANSAATTASSYNNKFNNALIVTVTACQATTNYTVTASSNPVAGGTTSGAGTYSSGTSVAVTATANNGYVFTNWTENGSVVSTGSNYTFNVFANRNLVANFTQSTTNYTVATSSNPVAGGTTSGAGTYASGASVTVIATANNGYTFSNWTENGNVVNSNTSYNFTISGNRNLVANFTQNPILYSVSLLANPVNGGLTTGTGNYASGTSVTVIAQAFSNFTFANWTENGNVASNNANYTFTITADRNLVANFLVTTGTGGPNNQNNISIYPNPSSGILNIVSDKKYELKIYNALGQTILITNLSGTTNQIGFSNTGVYLLQFVSKNRLALTKRVIIQR